VIPFCLGSIKPSNTTKVSRQGFTTSPVIQTQYTSPRWVTNKTKSNEPLYPSWQSEHYAPVPIDDPHAKPTTPPDSSNYSAKGVPFHPHGCTVILGGHSTKRSLWRGTQENGLSPLKISQDHYRDNIIVS
jgi:hypothetical protein